MAQVLFYKNPVAINRELHQKASVLPLKNYTFASSVNSVPLSCVEFASACKEYPIVFVKVDDKTMPVALLGFEDRQNLFVDEQGRWDASYIPAFIRRYPFVLAELENGEFALCVDEAVGLLDNGQEGQPLLAEDGSNSPYLNEVLAFLKAYQTQFEHTLVLTQKLVNLDLLKSMSIKTELKNGRGSIVNDVLVVDEEKLNALDAESILELHKGGDFGWIYAHLLSVSNMGTVLNRMKV